MLHRQKALETATTPDLPTRAEEKRRDLFRCPVGERRRAGSWDAPVIRTSSPTSPSAFRLSRSGISLNLSSARLRSWKPSE